MHLKCCLEMLNGVVRMEADALEMVPTRQWLVTSRIEMEKAKTKQSETLD